MASLTDLFNPTFLMFLGILVLVVALLVVYFETKFRDQNHKISSMLSLVSSLAEEVNGTKMIIHQLTMSQNQQIQQNTPFFYQNEGPILEETKQTKQIKQNNDLIAVSDDDSDSDAGSEASFDEDSDDEDSHDEDSDDEDSHDSVLDDDDSVSSEDNADVKVFKLNINKSDEASLDNLNDIDDLDNLDDLDEIDEIDDLDDTSSASSESVKEDKKAKESMDNFMDLKSINITLEETKPEQSVDYKKMALPKLRSVVTEKGLSSDSSKLKKNELLKLLGVE